MIHMKFQYLLSLKNKIKVFQNIICCSCDWRFKGYSFQNSTDEIKSYAWGHDAIQFNL